MQKDNGGKFIKLAMRQALLRKIDQPRILETNGGKGELGKTLYLDYPGAVFEKDKNKTPYLVEQRPHWAVYECDCVKAMQEGVGFHHRPNFIDLDPYGNPWPIMKVISSNADKLDNIIGVVVNDGLRKFASLGCAWKSEDLKDYVQRYGNAWINKNWEIMIRDKLEKLWAIAGYEIQEWTIRPSGFNGLMTQYAAVLKRKSPSPDGL